MARTKEPEKAWTPHPGPQQVFLRSGAREVLYGGARGGGKTDCLLYGALRQTDHPKYRALILRRTFPELREVMDRSHVVFSKLPNLDGGGWVASEKRWRFKSGATIEFGYCESFSDAMQYQGQEYTYIGFDEIGQLPDEKTWLFLMSNLRTTADGLRLQARASANPGGPGHGWLRRRFIVPCPPDGTPIFDEQGNSRAFVQARVYDNPTLMEKDPTYVQQLKALPTVMREQFLEGNWEVGSGLAFEELTETSHTVPAENTVPSHSFLFGSFDWGFGHKWSFQLFAVKPDGVIRVVDSTGGRRLIPSDIAERVGDLLNTYDLRFTDLAYTVAGSDTKAEERARGNWGPSIREQFSQYGWYLINADQARVAGYQNCLTYLHNKRVEFASTPGNVAGIKQLMEMVVDPDAPNDVLKVDADPMTGEGGDDFYDAWRYGLMSRPLVPKLPKEHLDRINRHFAKQQEQREVQQFPSRAPWNYRLSGVGRVEREV